MLHTQRSLALPQAPNLTTLLTVFIGSASILGFTRRTGRRRRRVTVDRGNEVKSQRVVQQTSRRYRGRDDLDCAFDSCAPVEASPVVVVDVRIRNSPTTTAVLTTFRERGRCLGEVEQHEDLIAWISVRSTHHQSPRGRDVIENGRQVIEADIKPLHAEFVAESPKKSKAKKPATKPDIEGQIDPIEAEADCKDKPLETPLAMSPQAFER